METRKELCERLYLAAVSDDTEKAWLRACFDVYRDGDAVAYSYFLPDEVPYSGGHVRRGMLDKEVLPIIEAAGGSYEPRFTMAGDIRTSHYALFRLGSVVITNSAVGEKSETPRAARFRSELQRGRVPKADMTFCFQEDEIAEPAADALMWMYFKHGKNRISSHLPQFATFQALDQRGFVVWTRDLFSSQIELTQELLNERENLTPDDAGIPTLKEHLRRILKKRTS